MNANAERIAAPNVQTELEAAAQWLAGAERLLHLAELSVAASQATRAVAAQGLALAQEHLHDCLLAKLAKLRGGQGGLLGRR